jgi:hypothetical protein
MYSMIRATLASNCSRVMLGWKLGACRWGRAGAWRREASRPGTGPASRRRTSAIVACARACDASTSSPA